MGGNLDVSILPCARGGVEGWWVGRQGKDARACGGWAVVVQGDGKSGGGGGGGEGRQRGQRGARLTSPPMEEAMDTILEAREYWLPPAV